MVVPAEGRKEDVPWAERWVVVGRGAEVGGKRKAEEGELARPGKRVKLSPSIISHESTSRKPCTIPTPNPVAQEIFDALSNQKPLTEAKGDVFLRPEALDRICTCESVRSSLPLPHSLPLSMPCANLVVVAAVYAAGKGVAVPVGGRTRVPPSTGRSERYATFPSLCFSERDADALCVGVDPSEEELTTQALEMLPRGQTIEALLAFNSMKYVPCPYLVPFRLPLPGLVRRPVSGADLLPA